jgi:HAD superfamily hydrolase (TIGR01509 family)
MTNDATTPDVTKTDERFAVIFDMDGVLIDSADAHFESWRRLANDLGKTVTAEQFRCTFGRQNRDVIPQLFGDGFDEPRIADLGETKERYYREIIREHVPAIAGAVELVNDCDAAGMKCAVGSSGHPENVALALNAMGLQNVMQTVVTGHDVTVGKPDPQVFAIAADRLDIPAHSCAVIEDAPAGIQAALSAGMTAIGITSEHPRDSLTRAHYVVDRLDELSPAFLGQLISQHRLS